MTGRRKRIVLLGAGHAHLFALKHARLFAERGHELVIVAPDVFWYSGLATGVLGGVYPPELDQVDVEGLIARGGGSFIRDFAIGLDPGTRLIRLANASPLSYDVLSIALGSAPPVIPGAENDPRAYAVKPIRRLWDLRRDLERRFAHGASPHVVVAGAGPTGCEIAANIARLAAVNRASVNVTVLAASAQILEQIPQSAVRKIRATLQQNGISFRPDARVVRIVDSGALLADGTAIGFDAFVNATGLRSSPLLKEFGVPLDPDGGMIVDERLRSIAFPDIHGAGDCVAFQGRALPKIGVYAIRQAPVLFANLLAAAEDSAPRRFRPQRHYLSILNLGDTGLALRGSLHWQGRAAFLFKDWIDRRFLRAYQAR